MRPPYQGHAITRLLLRAADGSDEAKEELYRLIYDDLRDAARRAIRDKHRGDLQTTALVHESLLRFENGAVMKRFSENCRVFFSVAVRAMQQILVDHYRRRRRETRVDMHDGNPFEIAIDNLERETGFDFEALSLAIDELKKSSPRQHAVVVHRFRWITR